MGIPERWYRLKPLPPDIQNRLENLSSLFKKEGVLLAYLFGSLADKGEKSPKPPGDLDLAILPAVPVAPRAPAFRHKLAPAWACRRG